MKRIISLALSVILALSAFAFVGASAKNNTDYSALGGEVESIEELHNGVTRTHIVTGDESGYGDYSFNILTVDIGNGTDLYIDATGAGEYANNADYVNNILEKFDDENSDKTVLAAVNADLWMMVPHTRTGPYTYGGVTYEDAVMKKGVSLPRGFVVYDGELITSQYMITETPYQGEFWSFGVTYDNKPLLGCPEIDIRIDEDISADGLNRLPANNSLVVYTDKGCLNHYALDDAYELLIDVGDYKITDGSTVIGTVTGIYNDETNGDPAMSEGKIILTARGDAVEKINGYNVGDEVSVSFSVNDRYGRNTEDWKNVKSAVGGHSPFVVDGVKREITIESGYPSTVVGIKNDGSVVMLTIDTGVDGKRGGISGNKYWRLADDLDLNCAMLLDGGGSTTMAVNYDGEYKIVNNPTDKTGPRTVINALVVSYGSDRGEGDKADIILPYESTDLSEVYFDTKEGRALIADRNESLSENTSDGVKFIANNLVNRQPSFTLSFGLPGTEHENAASVLAGSNYPTLSADEYKFVLLEMKSESTLRSNLQINYLSAGKNYAPSADSFKFNFIENNGEWNTYILDMSDQSAWSGQIHLMRFTYLVEAEPNGTYVDEGDSVVVRSVKFAKTSKDAARITASNKNADFFTDIVPGTWYYPAARYNIIHGNIQGTSATTFAPTMKLTRAMFVTMLGRIDGVNPSDYPDSPYSDVPRGAWMAPYVSWAYATGIATGYGDGRFGPSDHITREQVAAMIQRYCAFKGYDTKTDYRILDKFVDRAAISSWALGPLAYCNSKQIINGKSATVVAPLDETTRAEASNIIYSIITKMKLGQL